MSNANQVPFSKNFQRILPPEMLPRVEGRFREIYAGHVLPQDKRLLKHLTEYILPGLACYQLLREDGLSQEDALAWMDRLFDAMVTPGKKSMQQLGRLPFVYPLLRVVIKPFMGAYPAGGWDLEWIENSPTAVRFNIYRCFYHDVVSRYGAPELTASFCRTDDLVYDGMSPRLQWRRTQTIGRGATHCDFCFLRTVNGKK